MKKICIIWASSGIGKEALEQYTQIWYIVDFTLRDSRQKWEFQKLYPKSRIYTVDLNVLEQISSFWESISDTFYDIIIFAAGVGYYKTFENLKTQQLTEQLRVNTLAPIQILQEYFVSHDYADTKFVYLSSVLERIPSKNMSVYSASKSAATQILSAYKRESSELKILIVMLWAVKTPMHIKSWLERSVWKNLHKTVKKLIKTIDRHEWIRTLYLDWVLILWIIFPLYNLYHFLKNIWSKYL
jgi:short-subunit dehydrogenase